MRLLEIKPSRGRPSGFEESQRTEVRELSDMLPTCRLLVECIRKNLGALKSRCNVQLLCGNDRMDASVWMVFSDRILWRLIHCYVSLLPP
jgi:hypothetical protein